MKCPLTQEQVASLSLMRAVLAAWRDAMTDVGFDWERYNPSIELSSDFGTQGPSRLFRVSVPDQDWRFHKVGIYVSEERQRDSREPRRAHFVRFPAEKREVRWGEWVTEAGEHRSDRYGCEVAGFPMPEDVTMEKVVAWFLDHVIPGNWHGTFAEAAKSPAFQERVQLFFLADRAT